VTRRREWVVNKQEPEAAAKRADPKFWFALIRPELQRREANMQLGDLTSV